MSTGDWDNYAVKGQPPLSVLSSAAEARVLVAPDHKIEFTPARDLLTIDYAQETALFVVDRMHPCWYWLEVVAIEDVGDALEVHAVTWSPLGEGCLTAISQPFNIVAIPKTSKPIRLQPIGLDHEAFRPEARPTPPQR